MKKASRNHFLEAFVVSIGRCERIRTFDPLHPMQVRYQAAPHTDRASNYSRGIGPFLRAGLIPFGQTLPDSSSRISYSDDPEVLSNTLEFRVDELS